MLVWLATPTICPRYLTGGHKLSGNSQLHIKKSLKTEDFSNIQRSVTKSVTVTFLFRLEGLKLNDTDWINDFKEKRTQYGVSQNRLAVMAGVSREYVSRIESGKVALTEEIKEKFTDALEKLNPENPLEMVLDYVKIRFPTQDVRHVVEDILQLKLDVMIHEDYGFYSYAEHYVLGDVFVLTSPEKCNHEECISVFRSFKSYRSGELVRSNEQDRYGMGNTLYIGSLKSEVYFCIYEKDYEQYVKYDIPIEDTKIKNRFEIRLKNERAYYAVRDLLTYHDAERTAFDIINRYMRFADKEVEKRRSEWQTNEKWAYFIGSDRGRLKLTTKPEPYTLTRTLNWISRQVAPTWKVLQKIDSTNGTTYLKDILEHAKLTERHKKLIEQQTTSTEEMITETEE